MNARPTFHLAENEKIDMGVLLEVTVTLVESWMMSSTGGKDSTASPPMVSLSRVIAVGGQGAEVRCVYRFEDVCCFWG